MQAKKTELKVYNCNICNKVGYGQPPCHHEFNEPLTDHQLANVGTEINNFLSKLSPMAKTQILDTQSVSHEAIKLARIINSNPDDLDKMRQEFVAFEYEWLNEIKSQLILSTAKDI